MINHRLKIYIEANILPKYQHLDSAHGSGHIHDVIEKSVEISKDYDIDVNMVYAIAAFHDIGLIVERERHQIIGGEMLFNDSFLKQLFTLEQLTIMKEAVEDHRASLKNPPRSIYGKIIAEADRSDTMDTVIERSILYRRKNFESFEEIYPEIYEHIVVKYGENGYLKVWLDTKYVRKMLFDIRELLKDPAAFKQHTKNIYDYLISVQKNYHID